MKPAPAGPDLVRLIEAALSESAEEEKLLEEIRHAIEEGDRDAVFALAGRLVGISPVEAMT